MIPFIIGFIIGIVAGYYHENLLAWAKGKSSTSNPS